MRVQVPPPAFFHPAGGRQEIMNDKRVISLDRDLFPWEKEVLEECGLFLVGGVVRDLLLGKAHLTLDFDYIVTGITEDGLLALLSRLGRADLVGKSFGVIKFRTPEGITVDIALPRSEVSTGPGHRDFEVVSDPAMPVASDLERRDFTINSMALDLKDLVLVDPLGGVEDLRGKVLRVNRDTSFVEDPLRIMRGVQFLARFDLEVEAGTRALMERDRELLTTVSMERIRDELSSRAAHGGTRCAFCGGRPFELGSPHESQRENQDRYLFGNPRAMQSQKEII